VEKIDKGITEKQTALGLSIEKRGGEWEGRKEGRTMRDYGDWLWPCWPRPEMPRADELE